MADLKTLCMDGSCMNVPSGGGGDVTGVKGEQESTYRTGSVNLTPDNIAFLGKNATGGTANDTRAFWADMGSGYAFFNATGQVNGQPYQWGFIENLVNGNEVNQIWRGQDGKVYIRKANTSISAMPSWTPLDTNTTYTAGTNVQISSSNVISATDTKYTASSATPLMDGTATAGTSANYAREGHRHPTDTTRAPLASPALTGTPTAPTNVTASTSNTQIAPTAFTQNAINRRLPKTNTAFFSNTTAVSVANNTAVTWDLWTAPAAGTVIAMMHCLFATNSNGVRGLQANINGNGIGNLLQSQTSTGSTTALCVPVVRHLASGDKLQMKVYQTSGGALNVTARYCNGIWIPD